LVEDGTVEVVLAVRGAQSESGHDFGVSVTVSEVEYHADDPASIPNSVRECFNRFGGVDVAILAAGALGPVGDQLDASLPAIEALSVNSTGASVTLLEIAARMREVGFGTIVVLSSIAAERLRPSNFVYGASKSTADRLALALRSELAPAGVSVVVVRPGYVRTSLSREVAEAPFSVDADAVAQSVQKAIRNPRSRVIWVPSVLRVVGAVLRLLPAAVIKRLDRS
jgi:decaprenylphospho-beta-D-erythro-pentofuranosid-2-ulose 2-reductase